MKNKCINCTLKRKIRIHTDMEIETLIARLRNSASAVKNKEHLPPVSN